MKTSTQQPVQQPASLKKLPEARGSSLLANAHAAQNDPLNFYESLHRDYGDAVKVRGFIGYWWYIFTSPSATEYILQKHQTNFRKPDIFVKPVSLLTGKGILTSEGDFWLKQRRLSQPAFHRQHLLALSDMIVQCAQELSNQWESLPDGTTLNIHQEMVRLTLKVAGLALFSTDLSKAADQFGQALRETLEVVNYRMDRPLAPPIWVPLPMNRRFLKARKVLEDVVNGIIAERKKDKSEHHDFLGLLMAARDEQTGEGMSDQQLKDEAMTLLIAGHDTVAAALSWTWFLLGTHPSERSLMQAELDSVLANRLPSVQDLEKLVYTKMVFDESLRLYPPAWGQIRETINDDVIDGYPVPAKSMVSVFQWITHRDPKYWDNPNEFNPENFTPAKVASRPRFAYFPFGGGARICIGQHFALMEAQLTLATLARKFFFEIPEPQKVVPDATFTLIPEGGIDAVLRKRK